VNETLQIEGSNEIANDSEKSNKVANKCTKQ
jgi:hypothetical protein